MTETPARRSLFQQGIGAFVGVVVVGGVGGFLGGGPGLVIVTAAGAAIAAAASLFAFLRVKARRPYGVAAGFALGGIVLFGVGLGTIQLVRRVHAAASSTTCANQLRGLGNAFMQRQIMDEQFQPQSGAALFVVWARAGVFRVDPDVVVCPGDHTLPRTDSARRVAALAAIQDAGDPALADLVSYAVRDFERFPLDPHAERAEWLMCDRGGADGMSPHHPNGLNVLFDDGGVRFLDRQSLGLAPDQPIVVGPDSKHPELKKMLVLRR